MAKVTLYIATSVDGFIATKDGGGDWLSMVESMETDYGYGDFYRSIDAIAMGSKTYEQVLGFGAWPYAGKPCYVFTRRGLTSARKDVIFPLAGPDAVVQEMESQGWRNIWLVGGAQLIAAFLKLRLIDEYILSVIPILLGDGIPLFLSTGKEIKLQLVDVPSSQAIWYSYDTCRSKTSQAG